MCSSDLVGAHCEPVPAGVDAHTWWFAEGAGRLLVEVSPHEVSLLQERVDGEMTIVATTTPDSTLRLTGATPNGDTLLSLEDLRAAFCEVAS